MPTSADKKHIYVIYTGGTIGMHYSEHGYIPIPGFLAEQMQLMPELKHAHMPNYTIHEYQPLIDSSNMTPANWNRIAEDIANNYFTYDGFVILHGTDTMAFTASALSFMLDNLSKPIIVTGSQLPLTDIRNDAREKIITSLVLAQDYPVSEVCIYFNHKLLRGNRTRKVNSSSFDAFISPNYPALAKIGINITTNEHLCSFTKSTEPLAVRFFDNTQIAFLRLFPGISVELIANLLQPPLQGLIIESFGAGNAMDTDAKFLALLADAVKRDIVIINCTQCLYGSVDMQQYATGQALQDAGVISGFDLTPEAAVTKLQYLFSMGFTPAEIKLKMQANLRGEITSGL